jgi:cytochrome c biogenesis protein CcmG/thiol:disulfide interchange protein DsbE
VNDYQRIDVDGTEAISGKAAPGPARGMNRRLFLLAPLGVAIAGGGAFYAMLTRMQRGSFDPHDIGNPMLNKPMPDFTLPGFTSADVRAAAKTKPVLLNFFASWCIPCAVEAEAVGSVAAMGVPVWGMCYKDKPDKIAAFLNQYGNPYAKLADDQQGTTFINFGAYGVPESYLIDRDGIIRWHIAGPLSDDSVGSALMPAFRALS